MTVVPYTDGTPTEPGLYVAYVNGPVKVAADRKLLMWMPDGGWSYPGSDQKYRAHVYGYVGPLESLMLED